MSAWKWRTRVGAYSREEVSVAPAQPKRSELTGVPEPGLKKRRGSATCLHLRSKRAYRTAQSVKTYTFHPLKTDLNLARFMGFLAWITWPDFSSLVLASRISSFVRKRLGSPNHKSAFSTEYARSKGVLTTMRGQVSRAR